MVDILSTLSILVFVISFFFNKYLLIIFNEISIVLLPAKINPWKV